MISRRQFLQWAASLGAAGAAAFSYAFLFEPLWRLKTTRYDLQPKQWPRGFELKIAVLADLHACRPWMDVDRIDSIVRETNALGADIILLLGDYVIGHRYILEQVHSSEWSKALAKLKAPLGVHAILGNHEWWDDREVQRAGTGSPYARRVLESVGIPVYENEAVQLSKAGKKFWLAGLGDQLAYVPSRRLRPGVRVGVDDLAGTLAGITDDAPVILMAHEPDIMTKVPARVALTLSGHTHGGQFRLFGWSPVVPSLYGNRYAYGHVREQCDLVVSGGLGCSIAPVRFGVPPEIVFVTLGGPNAA
jgi:predicted MPP superfamily phosphohydrolase